MYQDQVVPGHVDHGIEVPPPVDSYPESGGSNESLRSGDQGCFRVVLVSFLYAARRKVGAL
jgi:hypothetical protein